ncbi:MAG: arginyltransferase [gamma proteobacterium symbiont of Ctena orbiculata]|nr:arginyltransferase [Candidatus Thiodiazotropha taylori]PUB88955.1 MAG: arginyltransferase [gamma proteobacterium symbiont of Ctena orbiculata]MBT2996719.1 arginyltransferase [Candidatus Thiodiazotropha taylori]MBT3001409.1 arginyltransferase [Candidatus Thiodiazotropha taylori]MBT3027212.1 arginyltransferase [Candidatus Thiodiazotropha taylori]
MLNTPPGFEQEGSYALYLSQVHGCSYLPGREARNLFLDPNAKVTLNLYQQLIDRGFRRSGCYLYQPACPHCNDCISLRIPTARFQPSRSQRRIWKRNLPRYEVNPGPAEYRDEHYRLYQQYLIERHPDGAMVCNSPGQYTQFLTCDWAETRFIEFRKAGELAAVAVTDLLPEGASSVYTFFDPQLARESLGIFALLWQIDYSRRLGLKWVYPGFWIESCDKMSYKSRFRPFEAWTGQQWIDHNKLNQGGNGKDERI